MQNNYKWKEMIFNSWFEKRTIKFKEQRNGKFCDSQIIFKHKAFSKTFSNCYKRFQKHYTERNDCICDCIMLTWEGINAFEINGESTWEQIATGNDPKNYGKLVTYCKGYVTHELERKLYPKICTSTKIDTPEGKKFFLVYYNVEPESLNRLINWKGEKEKIELINCMDKSYWTKKEEYKMNLFMQWAIENMEDILNENQLKFLQKLEDANYSKLDAEYDEELIGIDRNNIRQRLKRIYEKLAKEYAKAHKFFDGGYMIQTLNAELKVFKKVLDILDNEEIEEKEINARLSAQILKSMNNSHFERLLYDNLDNKTMKTIIRMYNYSAIADDEQFQLFVEPIIPKKFLYKIVSLLQERVDYLNMKIEEEIAYLERQAKKEKVKVKFMQFDPSTNKKCIHLKMNGFGIAVPKYED